MFTTIKRISVVTAIAGLLTGGAIMAFAQTPDPHHLDESQPMMGGGMMGRMKGGGMMEMMANCPMRGMMMGAESSTFAEGRVAFLKAELAITEAQKAVWDAYAAALKKNLQGMQDMRQIMMKVMEAKSPVERLDAHITAMDARLATLKDAKPALAALYGTLNDEQKKKADQILTGMGCMM